MVLCRRLPFELIGFIVAVTTFNERKTKSQGMAHSLDKKKSVQFSVRSLEFGINQSASDCKDCGDECGLIIYKEFASTYVSMPPVTRIEDLEPLELINNDSMIPEKSDYQDGTDQRILSAKRKYLRYHHNKTQSLEFECKYAADKCSALSHWTKTIQNDVLNGFSELEQAHITFYHPHEFDQRRSVRNRQRSCRWFHYNSRPHLSNRDLNPELPSTMLSASLSQTVSLSTNPSLSDTLPSNPESLKWTRSVKYHKLSVKKQKNKVPATDVLLFGFPFETKTAEAAFANPKEEVLQATVLKTRIRVCEWNNLLRSSTRYVKMRNALKMQLRLKEVIALKLYTDFDDLQREYRRCFRVMERTERIDLQKNFVHWNLLLVSACKKAKDDIGETLYHGVASLNKASAFNGKYYGPVSTTTILDVARQFSGATGTILELHSAYSKAGMRLSWLSNYPDEDEVLYMNVTFQITDIIDPKTEKSKLWPMPSIIDHKYEEELEQIKHELQQISINSKVLSLNESHDMNEKNENVMVINKISILNLLYLQYKPRRWGNICDKNTKYAETLTMLREQFVHLIENIKAVQMDDTSPLIQHFFSSDQSEYEVPSNINRFNKQFKQKKHHYFKLQTIIRLFPEAEEIGINANNWDFTLNEFVEFLMKWHYDYTAVSLKYISLKFDDDKRTNKTCDERAIAALEEHYASANISKLSTLGWKFLTPSTLSRVPFDPGPELPFLLSFVQDENRDSAVFYRSNTLQLLDRDADHKSLEGCVDPADEEEEKKANANANDEVIRIHHNPKICILSTAIWDAIEYKEELTKLLNKVRLDMLESPQGPGALSLQRSRSCMNESFQRACDDVKSLTLEPLPADLVKVFMTKDGSGISYQAIYDIFPNVTDIFLRETEFTVKECDRLCAFLTHDIKRFIPFERIFYKQKELKDSIANETPFDRLKRSASRMGSFVFTEDYEWDPDEKDQDNHPLPIDDELQTIAQMLRESADWSFQEHGQIAFCNDIYKHHQCENSFFVLSKVSSI
eukprot:1078355_1